MILDDNLATYRKKVSIVILCFKKVRDTIRAWKDDNEIAFIVHWELKNCGANFRIPLHLLWPLNHTYLNRINFNGNIILQRPNIIWQSKIDNSSYSPRPESSLHNQLLVIFKYISRQRYSGLTLKYKRRRCCDFSFLPTSPFWSFFSQKLVYKIIFRLSCFPCIIHNIIKLLTQNLIVFEQISIPLTLFSNFSHGNVIITNIIS